MDTVITLTETEVAYILWVLARFEDPEIRDVCRLLVNHFPPLTVDSEGNIVEQN